MVKNNIYRSLRREEVVLTRLRIGHTRLTNSYLLKREDQPFCISCNEPFTVKHFLIDCIEFSHVRPRVLDFLPCRGPGGSISTGNIGVIQSLSPLGRAKGSTTCLPWVASRKPEEGVLEVEGYLEYVHSDAQHASLAWISV